MRYRVTGSNPVYRTLPGSTFEADLPQDQEARLIAAGHIALAAACEVCGFEAKNEQGLAAHRRTHEQEDD